MPGDYRSRQDAQVAKQAREQIAYCEARQEKREMAQQETRETARPVHSPLGASGAERWMNCPGSTRLLHLLTLPETDEPDYTREGTAMHEAAAHCLNTHTDTWEIVGKEFYGTVITDEMAIAVQVHLDYCRRFMTDEWQHYVEYDISSPVHKDFYGRLDFGSVGRMMPHIRVHDFKGGKGIIVEPEDNPQLKYYAFGLIDGLERSGSGTFPPDTPVVLAVIQPRAWHWDGPVREWETTVGAIKAWVQDVLVPAMNLTAVDDRLDAGDWCRFCPAKLACPLLTSLFGAAALHNPKHLPNLDDESIGRSYAYIQAVKHYLKALEEETFRRLSHGRETPGAKLVAKKAHRVFTPEGARLARVKFGAQALTAPELKSPAEIEKIGPDAAAFVAEHAYMPLTGYTVARENDYRQAVKMQSASEAFGTALDKEKAGA